VAALFKLAQQIATGDFTIGAIGLPKIPEAAELLRKMGSTPMAVGAKQLANQFQIDVGNDPAANADFLLRHEKKI